MFFTAVGIATCLIVCIGLSVLSGFLVFRWTHVDGRLVGLWLPAVPGALSLWLTYLFYHYVPLQIIGG